MAKLLDFQASISDVKQVNPLFSTCKVRVLYTGKNRNMSIITKDAVEKALPTLKNIPIVGEFSEAVEDYKGHGGAIDLDSWDFIHTTKPYGVVPESATYEWEEIKGSDGATREYLTIHGCYLWTGRYKEAYTVIEKGKGQSMEIEVIDGKWVEEDDAYRIDNFIFSALCILGDEFEPAFEDASITAYSLDKDSFRKEFSLMLKELKSSLSQEKEVNDMNLKELLEKYSLKVEDLTAKGIDFNDISIEELEEKIIEVFEIDVEGASQADQGEGIVEGGEGDNEPNGEGDEPNGEGDNEPQDDNVEPVGDEGGEGDNDPVDPVDPQNVEEEEEKVDVEQFEARIAELEGQLNTANETINSLTEEVEGLREFKLNTEKAEHETKAQELFTNFQLTEEDIEGLNVHEFSIEQIEEKCYAILGRKMASKKNFTKEKNQGGNIRIQVKSDDNQVDKSPKPYGDLFDKYKK